MTLNKEGPVWRTDNLCIRALSITDQDTLAEIYLRLKREGLLPILFHEGVPDLAGFLSAYLKPHSLTMLCFTESPHVDICGMGHVTPPWFIGKDLARAETSMVFFDKWQRRDVTVPMAHLMCEYAFETTPSVQALFGTTPVPNKAAVRFITAAGFVRSTEPVPHYSTWQGQRCACYISWLTRERWAEIRPFRGAV